MFFGKFVCILEYFLKKTRFFNFFPNKRSIFSCSFILLCISYGCQCAKIRKINFDQNMDFEKKLNIRCKAPNHVYEPCKISCYQLLSSPRVLKPTRVFLCIRLWHTLISWKIKKIGIFRKIFFWQICVHFRIFFEKKRVFNFFSK